MRFAILAAAILLAAAPARAQSGVATSGVATDAGSGAAASATFTVRTARLPDEKAVFATVESLNVVPARARIGGTIAALSVKDGDHVELGQVIGVVGDEKLILQISSLDAQIAGIQSQLAQAQIDLTRAEQLFRQGAGPRTTVDQSRTAVDVATSQLRARTAERQVVQQQLAEGQVLAPTSGRVLTVPVTKGTVVLNGDTIATIAEQNYVLRLRIPERNATSIGKGDRVRVDNADLGAFGAGFGTITLVYPQIDNGRVVADAQVSGIGEYFVGQRIRVWIAAGERNTIILPASFIETRFGLDYVRLRRGDAVVETPIQRGQDRPSPALTDGVEVLSGLAAGDVLVRP